MRIAITGASGLIGSALSRAIEARGDTAVPVVRGDRPGSQQDAVWWSPTTKEIDADALNGIDAVVHLAGESIGSSKWTDDQKARIRNSRVAGTTLLAETLAGLAEPPAVFVSGSAIGIYGDRGNEELTETSADGTGFLANVVAEWEAAAQPALDAGIRTAFCRMGVVLSTNGGALSEQLLPFKLGLGGKIGSGDQYLPWISIDDVVGALLYLVDGDLAGPVNITAPSPATNSEFTKALGNALHRPTLLPIPTFALHLRLGKELTDALLMSSARVLPTRLLEDGFVFQHPTLSEALEAVL